MYQDLHPYCCTFEHCPTADRLYDSRHGWFAHELEAHRTSFQCIEECKQDFVDEAKFRHHVQGQHPNLAAPAVFSALKMTSVSRVDVSEQAVCKLCSATMTLRKLRKHLGQHQEQLALFALPNLPNESDDESLASDQEAPRVENIDHEELTDSSNDPEASEPLAEFEFNDGTAPREEVPSIDVLSHIETKHRTAGGLSEAIDEWIAQEVVKDYAGEEIHDPNMFEKKRTAGDVLPRIPPTEPTKGTTTSRAYERLSSHHESSVIEGNVLRDDISGSSSRSEQLAEGVQNTPSDANAGANRSEDYKTSEVPEAEKQPNSWDTPVFVPTSGSTNHAVPGEEVPQGVALPQESDTEIDQLTEESSNAMIEVDRVNLTAAGSSFQTEKMSDVIGASHDGSELRTHGNIERDIDDVEFAKVESTISVQRADPFEEVSVAKAVRDTPGDTTVREQSIEARGRGDSGEAKGESIAHAASLTDAPTTAAFERIRALNRARGEAGREVRADNQTAVDANNKRREGREDKVAEDRKRIIYDSEQMDSFELDPALRKEHEELLQKIKQENTAKEIDREEFEAVLRHQRAKKATDEARQVQENEEREVVMRARLRQLGFQKNQVEAMVQQAKPDKVVQKQAGSVPQEPTRPATKSTYAKIRREYLDTETLHYFDIPYEYDTDPNYIIVLRELNQSETNVLFEHTRKHRRSRTSAAYISAEEKRAPSSIDKEQMPGTIDVNSDLTNQKKNEELAKTLNVHEAGPSPWNELKGEQKPRNENSSPKSQTEVQSISTRLSQLRRGVLITSRPTVPDPVISQVLPRRRDSRHVEDCTVPGCTVCGPDSVEQPSRPRQSRRQSMLQQPAGPAPEGSYHFAHNTRSQASDPAVYPSLVDRDRRPQIYHAAPARPILQSAMTRRPSIEQRPRSTTYFGDLNARSQVNKGKARDDLDLDPTSGPSRMQPPAPYGYPRLSAVVQVERSDRVMRSARYQGPQSRPPLRHPQRPPTQHYAQREREEESESESESDTEGEAEEGFSPGGQLSRPRRPPLRHANSMNTPAPPSAFGPERPQPIIVTQRRELLNQDSPRWNRRESLDRPQLPRIESHSEQAPPQARVIVEGSRSFRQEYDMTDEEYKSKIERKAARKPISARRTSRVYDSRAVGHDYERDHDDDDEEVVTTPRAPLRRRDIDTVSRRRPQVVEVRQATNQGNSTRASRMELKTTNQPSTLDRAESPYCGELGSDEDTNGEIRLRVNNNAPVTLTLSGEMEGRSLRLEPIPGENGMNELVISGNTRAGGSVYRKERASVRRAITPASQAQRTIEGMSEQSSQSSRRRQVTQGDQDEPRRMLRPSRRERRETLNEKREDDEQRLIDDRKKRGN
jgi:hypothetical protein